MAEKQLIKGQNASDPKIKENTLENGASSEKDIILKTPSSSAPPQAGQMLDLQPFPDRQIDSNSSSYPEIEELNPAAETIEAFQNAKIDPVEKLGKEYELLSVLEKKVLIIAKSIIKKKKYDSVLEAERIETMSPMVEQLYSKCIAKLTHTQGFSKEDIFSAIQSLKEKKWIVSEQRRTREEILEADTLRNVLKFIGGHPGTHARDPDIETEIQITRNPFIKHVMVLEAFGLIRTKKIGRTQNYFLIDVPEIFDDYVVLFSNPLVPDIIKLLLQEDIGLSEIARRLGVYHGAIQYHIKNLIKMNILTKHDNSFSVNRSLLKSYNELYKNPPFSFLMK